MRRSQARLIVAISGACALAACASRYGEPFTSPDWRPVSEVEGCVTYESHGGEPHDTNIVLLPDLEAALLRQVKFSPDDESRSRCWYLTPTNEIRLDVIAFCVGGTTVTFQKVAADWISGGTNVVTQICEPLPR
jgi:hypothetical protein